MKVYVSPVEGTRSPERDILWQATAETPKGRLQVTGRAGLMNKVARALVDLGITEGPMRMFTEGKLALTYQSIVKAAGRDVKETRGLPIRGIKWQPMPEYLKAA